MLRQFFSDRINKILTSVLEPKIIKETVSVTGLLIKETGYKENNILPVVDSTWREFGANDFWGKEKDSHAWFYKKLQIPEHMRNTTHALMLSDRQEGWDATNPQYMVYLNGELVQGVDINHRTVLLNGDAEYELYLYAYAGMHEEDETLKVELITLDLDVEKLYYDIFVPYQILSYSDENTRQYAEIITYLTNAVNLLDTRDLNSKEFYDSVKKASEYLENEFYGKYCGEQETSVICIGHTHIDVAWLWTLAQTKEKTQRSFSIVLKLMEEFPEYKFMSSQARLYKYLKEEAPEIYEKVKEMVRQGRWEVEGAMWVEADCNLTSGESLVRQVLFGKRFFKNEFGIDTKILWLPDVFGYSAALPQILKKSGVDTFLTSKISWNERNMMPNDIFNWQGIDGTEIFSYFLTAQDKKKGEKPSNFATYNGNMSPQEVAGTYDRMHQKDITDEVLLTFGYGDGGGGPTRHMLNMQRRTARGIPGCPQTKIEPAGRFIERVSKKAAESPFTPKWVGELYLELHRGTYTSNAKNKYNNRRSELEYQNTELLCSLDEKLLGNEYPREEINENWETILTNQFHDIIPGSSIREVYEDSDVEYAHVLGVADKLSKKAIDNLISEIKTDGGVLVFNPQSWANSGVVDIDGEKVYVENVPAKGYKVVKTAKVKSAISVSENRLENDFFIIELDSTGAFTRFYDKKNNREILKDGRKGNLIEAFEDFPKDWDAWEISDYYTQKKWYIDEVVSVRILDEGARAGLEITKKFLNSTFTQKIYLYNDIAKVDFENDVDWHQQHLIVKANFPVDVNTSKATYDIQFGHVERPTHKNTSWDAAKFEVCAHKFADLSEYGYGVSMLNDCKYGHDIHDGEMRLTLLKCATYPSEVADQGRHKFTYSLYPHAGDFKEAETIRLAYDLNNPMRAFKIEANDGKLPDSWSALTVSQENVIAETVKKAEDDEAYIIRAYEAHNKRTTATFELGFDIKEAFLCDLMENEIEEIKLDGNKFTLNIKPFEIVTIKVK